MVESFAPSLYRSAAQHAGAGVPKSKPAEVRGSRRTGTFVVVQSAASLDQRAGLCRHPGDTRGRGSQSDSRFLRTGFRLPDQAALVEFHRHRYVIAQMTSDPSLIVTHFDMLDGG